MGHLWSFREKPEMENRQSKQHRKREKESECVVMCASNYLQCVSRIKSHLHHSIININSLNMWPNFSFNEDTFIYVLNRKCFNFIGMDGPMAFQLVQTPVHCRCVCVCVYNISLFKRCNKVTFWHIASYSILFSTYFSAAHFRDMHWIEVRAFCYF